MLTVIVVPKPPKLASRTGTPAAVNKVIALEHLLKLYKTKISLLFLNLMKKYNFANPRHKYNISNIS